MEITRKLILNTSLLPGTPFILITDINNSTLCNKVEECLRTVNTSNNPTKQQQQQQRTQATNLVITAVQEVLIGVLDELQTTLPSETKLPTKVHINLNLYHRQFSIPYWDSLITWIALPSVLKLYQEYDTDLRFVDKVTVYVTFQTDVDKQRYVESTVSTLRQFRERMDNGLSGVQNVDLLCDDDEREFLTKLVLLNLFRRKNLRDDEIEGLLSRNSCVAEVLDELYSRDS